MQANPTKHSRLSFKKKRGTWEEGIQEWGHKEISKIKNYIKKTQGVQMNYMSLEVRVLFSTEVQTGSNRRRRQMTKVRNGRKSEVGEMFANVSKDLLQLAIIWNV